MDKELDILDNFKLRFKDFKKEFLEEIKSIDPKSFEDGKQKTSFKDIIYNIVDKIFRHKKTSQVQKLNNFEIVKSSIPYLDKNPQNSKGSREI